MNLLHFVDNMLPDLIFLSEPQLFQCDAEALTSMFRGKYCYNLNSEDVHCPELPLAVRKAHGGTMVLWKVELDPYIRVPVPLLLSSQFSWQSQGSHAQPTLLSIYQLQEGIQNLYLRWLPWSVPCSISLKTWLALYI